MKNKILSIRALPVFLVAQCVPHSLPAQLDTGDRWIVRDFFSYVYPYGSDVGIGWTGTYDGNNSTAGDISEAWRDATRMRINFYRHMAGVSPNITFDPDKNAASQESALILSDTHVLNHNPQPGNSVFWTADGQEAAMKGNIAIGSIGTYAVDGYMVDSGQLLDTTPEPDSVSNFQVGHRRWILYPQADIMGSGDVPGNGFQLSDFWAANTIWVQPANPFSSRPLTRDDFVAWPPPGYVPANLVWSRWSLSYPGADFSTATVTMTGQGGNIPLFIEHVTDSQWITGAPESSIVWVPNSMDRTQVVTWPIGETDEDISVQVSGATVQGQPVGPFTYTVNIFNPLTPGHGETLTTLQAPLSVGINTPANFTVVASRDWKESVQGRTFETGNFSEVFDAESGLGTITERTTGNYDIIISGRAGNATSVYRLAQTNTTDQVLELPGTYLVGTSQPQLSFLSNLSFATAIQSAQVEVNAGDGYNWQPVWSTSGLVEYVTTFQQVDIDLSPFEGQTLAVRFRYSLTGVGSWYGQSDTFIGWAFDDITLSDVQEVVNAILLPIESSGDTITATFGDTAPVYIQAREFAFSEMDPGGFALDWGPAIQVTPDGFTLAGTAINSWTNHATVGWIYGVNADWIYSFHLGWLYVPGGSWLDSGIGWIKYITGTLEAGLWLYHPVEGFIYVRKDYPGIYLRSPFSGSAETIGSFSP